MPSSALATTTERIVPVCAQMQRQPGEIVVMASPSWTVSSRGGGHRADPASSRLGQSLGRGVGLEDKGWGTDGGFASSGPTTVADGMNLLGCLQLVSKLVDVEKARVRALALSQFAFGNSRPIVEDGTAVSEAVRQLLLLGHRREQGACRCVRHVVVGTGSVVDGVPARAGRAALKVEKLSNQALVTQ